MTREEAIEVYKGLLNKKIKEAFEFFAPELAVSEDEKIRRWLVELVENQMPEVFIEVEKPDVFRWLEKQKEQKPEVDESTKRLNENWMKQHFDDYKEQKPAEVCYGPKGDPDPAGIQMDEIGRLIFRCFRKVLASFGVYAEDEILLESKEETLCYYSQKCAEEILKSLRPQPKKELSIEKAIQWLDDTFYFLDNSSGRGRDCEITTHDFDSLEEMYNSFRKAVIVDSEPHWKPRNGLCTLCYERTLKAE